MSVDLIYEILLTIFQIRKDKYRYTTYMCVYVVVNFFLSQLISIFPLFQLHLHTLPYPKTKEKQKLPEKEN